MVVNVKPRARSRRNAASIDEQLHRKPFWKEQLGIGIDARKRKGLQIDERQPPCASGSHHSVPRPARAGREQIVEREPNPDRPAPTAAWPQPDAGERLPADQPGGGGPEPAPSALHGQIELELPHEVWSQPNQPVAFDEALADQPNLAEFQIPQTAVDQPGRPGGGAGGDVACIDHDYAHARERKLPGDGGAVDACPNHDNRFSQ